jgi:hypothetical protein
VTPDGAPVPDRARVEAARPDAPPLSGPLTPDLVLALQRSSGNALVSRMMADREHGLHGRRPRTPPPHRQPAGRRSMRPRAASARSASPSADEIRRGLGLDVLQKEVVAAAEAITLEAAEAAAFRTALRTLGKFVSKAGILGFLLSFGLDDGDLDCEQGPLYMRAKPAFKHAAHALNRAAHARGGPHTGAIVRIAYVQIQLSGLEAFIAGNEVIDRCQGPNKVALKTIETLRPMLDAASARLARLAEPPTKQECKTAMKILRGFRRLVKEHAPGTSTKRIEQLQRKLDEGTLRPDDLPARVRRRIPGRFYGKTIREIEHECRHAQ